MGVVQGIGKFVEDFMLGWKRIIFKGSKAWKQDNGAFLSAY